ncbi:hypothetical protein LOTGIDRAFT_156833 [Lottia gigantea]|uniref:Nose resistant-to-fluoxetine protein N-terminal domain-containing protein n=1 Tax=Lottia gigantea TaxID=225164 RepID=V4B5S3_LOTGI|nr:hypothetical protein LOTGIDRAFT_156833 [Lottia gigantea]ESP02881.1 hypothetical protein LOTGIDRAFT_156833 [Lottia gigantea]
MPSGQTTTLSTSVVPKGVTVTSLTTVAPISKQSTDVAQTPTKPRTSTAKPKKPLDIFTVINELTSNASMTNETLEYLVNVIGDKNNKFHVFLPTLLAIDTRTPIALLKKVLVHPDYSVKMLDALAKDVTLAKLVLKPVFDKSNDTADILSMIFSSEKLTIKLLEMLSAKPMLSQIVVEGMVKRIDVVLSLLSNYNQLIGQILSKPENVVRLIAVALQGTPLKDSLIGKFMIDPVNQVTISNLIKFIQGRNDSGVELPPIFVPAIIRNLLANTQLGNFLTALKTGQIKTFQQLIGAIQGISQNISEVPEAIFKSVINFFISRGNDSFNSTDANNELVSTLYKDALHNTTIGKLLGSLETGKLPNIVQITSLAKGLVQNLHEVPTVLKQLTESLEDNLQDQCAVDSLFSAVGLFHLESWALKFIDASGKPERSILKGNIAFMGAYDECTEISQQVTNKHGSHLIEGGYCELAFTIPEAFFNTFAKSAAHIEGVSHDLRLDLCLPKSCREEMVNRTLVNLLGVGLSTIHCKEDKSLKGDTGAYVALAVFGFLGFLCILGTAYDIYFSLKKVKGDEDDNEDVDEVVHHESEKNGHVGPVLLLTKFTGSEEDGLPQVEKGGEYKIHDEIQAKHKLDSSFRAKPVEANRFFMAFSIRANAKKILNASQPKGSLTCLNGIRVISMSWIIIGHILTTFNTTVENSTEALEFIETFSFQIMLNAPLAVDTFFILSGLLVCYLFVKEIDKTGKIKLQHMFMYYFHRIWRLTPLYALVLLFYTCLSQYLASGPFDDEHPLYRENCRKYWWRNLLYINTLFDTKEMVISLFTTFLVPV